MSEDFKIQRNDLLPAGVVKHPPKWDVLVWAFGGLDPWIVGGAARSMYFGLCLTGDAPKDWDIVVPACHADKIEECLKKSSADSMIVMGGKKEPQASAAISTVVQNNPLGPVDPNADTILKNGWRGVIKTNLVQESGVDEMSFDLWVADIGDYLSTVPTAMDGIAIRLMSKAVLMTHEFSMCKNALITDRPIKRTISMELFSDHMKHQGL